MKCSICKEEGHKANNKKFHPDDSAAKVQKALIEVPPTIKTPPWYTLEDILPFATLVTHMRGLYAVQEGHIKPKSITDTTLRAFRSGFDTPEDLANENRARLRGKAFEQETGKFHQNILGSLPGYKSLPNGGNGTSIDVIKTDGTVSIEVANRNNSKSHGGLQFVARNLQAAHDKGSRAIYAMIQCEEGKPIPRHKMPKDVEVMNGQQIYALASGRETFFKDLDAMVACTTHHFKTYEALLRGNA